MAGILYGTNARACVQEPQSVVLMQACGGLYFLLYCGKDHMHVLHMIVVLCVLHLLPPKYAHISLLHYLTMLLTNVGAQYTCYWHHGKYEC